MAHERLALEVGENPFDLTMEGGICRPRRDLVGEATERIQVVLHENAHELPCFRVELFHSSPSSGGIAWRLFASSGSVVR